MVDTLPDIISKFVAHVNNRADGSIAELFTGNAIVNDKHRFFTGSDEIAKWSDSEFAGIGVVIEVAEHMEHYGDHILTAKFSGGFDKALFDQFTVNNSIVVLNGPMPEALHALFFSVAGDKITQLIITPIDGSWPLRVEGEAFYVSRPAQAGTPVG